MFAFAELIKNYNAAASDVVTNHLILDKERLYEETARLLEFNFKESIIFYGMFSIIIVFIGIILYIIGRNRRMDMASRVSFY